MTCHTSQEAVYCSYSDIPDSKVHGTNMGPAWGRQDPGGPHVGPMNLAIWHILLMFWFPSVQGYFPGIEVIICSDYEVYGYVHHYKWQYNHDKALHKHCLYVLWDVIYICPEFWHSCVHDDCHAVASVQYLTTVLML